MRQLLVGEVLDVDETIARGIGNRDELVELGLQRPRVLVLRMLNQEHHQERHDGRTRVDDELPSIREQKIGPVNNHSSNTTTATTNASELPERTAALVAKRSNHRFFLRRDTCRSLFAVELSTI
jgi:hypothetical protein